MNAETFFKIVMNNQADIKEIIDKLGGIDGLLDIMPDLFRIWKTATNLAAQGHAANGVAGAKAALKGFDHWTLPEAPVA